MMDKNNILASGILERYLLGELPNHEEEWIEKMIEENADLKKAFQKLESDFERIGQENAIMPPPLVKEKIIRRLHKTDETSVISMDTNRMWKQYLAIAVAFVVIFGMSSFWFYSRMVSSQNDMQIVEQEKRQLLNELEEQTDNYSDLAKWYEAINNPNAIKLILKGNKQLPNATAISYINHKDKSVILNTSGLPTLNNDEDYQLWADVDGEMIDMGVIKKNSPMIAMRYIDDAESLNITIEPLGGNDHPTVERLISNVYLN